MLRLTRSSILPRFVELRSTHSGSGAGKDRLPPSPWTLGAPQIPGAAIAAAVAMVAAELAVALDLPWLREVLTAQRLPLVMLPPGLGPVLLWAACPMVRPTDFILEYLMVPEVCSPRLPWQVSPRPPLSERDHSAAPALAVVLQELRLWVRAQCLRLPALLLALPQECLLQHSLLKLSLDPPKREARILQEE